METIMRSKVTWARLTHSIHIFAALLAMGLASPSSFAQAPAAAPSSVLPSGGGQALLDPSDSVVLLLDHQAGLFQTVKDISIAELLSNTV
jgi:hypothetical protein